MPAPNSKPAKPAEENADAYGQRVAGEGGGEEGGRTHRAADDSDERRRGEEEAEHGSEREAGRGAA